MTKKQYYSLDEIFKMLNIPKSTLRYWEKEKLISSFRNSESQYREYSTSQLIDICEIKFYRDLNFSIPDIKKMYSNDFEANHLLIEEARNSLYSKIEQLQQTIIDIEKYQYRHSLIESLKENKLVKQKPDFNKLYYFHPGKTPNLINYLKNPSILSFVTDPEDTHLKHFTTFEKNSAVKPVETIWEYNEEKEYFCFLLTSKENILNEEQLANNSEEIKHLGYTPEKVIGRYLITENLLDYYQVWIEAKKTL